MLGCNRHSRRTDLPDESRPDTAAWREQDHDCEKGIRKKFKHQIIDKISLHLDVLYEYVTDFYSLTWTGASVY